MSTPHSGEPLLQFPCAFPIKAVGKAGENFEERVVAIVRRHAPELRETAVVSRPSKGVRFTAVTVHVMAESQAQLDAIYGELSTSPEVIMAL